MSDTRDRWHRWLLGNRFGDDAEIAQRTLTEFFYPLRDAVLDKACLGPGETLLDVGTGDGLIAFGGLERVGATGRVIFSDISADLLEHCHKAAVAEKVADRCGFLLAPADDLGAMRGGSVDVITTRSVLIYVKNKAAALAEFHRVLAPGGRISLFEPIFSAMSSCDPTSFTGYDVGPVGAEAAKVQAFFDAIQPPGEDPMFDFDERDLVRHAINAGFAEVSLELKLGVSPRRDPVAWDVFLRLCANPKVPSIGEAIGQALTAEEARRFSEYLRPLVESGTGRSYRADAYLTATR